jgi:predicted  nucleic acid-binding Zn-ribbon protein
MLPILEQLLVLQDRDRRIAQLKQEAARIPAELAAVDARIQNETDKLGAMKDRLTRIEADRKKLEIDADSHREQIAKWQTQLSQIKSNVEYQALLKEIAKAEAQILRIEDRELELMSEAEETEPAFAEEKAQQKEITDRGAQEKTSLTKRQGTIEEELARVQQEREKLADEVDAEALSRYERLFRSKGDMAIAPINHGNCGGCHLKLTPQSAHNARHGAELTSCDYCGRILYWPGE